MKTESAKTAAAIRKELKAAFPTVKFSVTSDNFSMGDAVRIRYEDGPKTDEVTAIVDKYQYGSFDGMTDCYNYDNSRNDIPQAKYVQVSRSMSEKAEILAKQIIAEHYGIVTDQDCMSKLGIWLNTACYRLSCGTL